MAFRRIGVFGSKYSDPKIVENARQIGTEIAQRGLVLVTGASTGLSYEAVLAAHNKGGTCIGYSPARDMQEHRRWGFPVEGFSNIVFVREDYEHLGNQSVCLKYRNVSSVAAVDLGIIMGGRVGTLMEFLLLYQMNKDIGVLEYSGGITGFVTEDSRLRPGIIENILGQESRNSWSKPRVVFEHQPIELVKRLLNE